jgi:hypothetical protein
MKQSWFLFMLTNFAYKTSRFILRGNLGLDLNNPLRMDRAVRVTGILFFNRLPVQQQSVVPNP